MQNSGARTSILTPEFYNNHFLCIHIVPISD
jgi:hypothetical protein